MVAEMGGLAEKQIADAIEALAKRDARSRQARGRRRCRPSTRCSARSRKRRSSPSPAASRWRSICARSSARCASPTISSASATSPRTSPSAWCRSTGDFHPQKLIRGVEHMAALVLAQLKQVLDAYAGRDLAKALAVWKGDEEIDAMCTSLFRELLTYMMEDPRNITFCIHLMFCAKNIERMGDHATNIAETVHYMVEGPPDRRPAAEGRHHGRRSPPSIERKAHERNEPAHPDRRGRRAADAAAALQPRSRGLRGRDRGARRRGRHAAQGTPARPRGPRLDAAGPLRHRAVPPAAGAPGNQAAADHHADRARRGERARARAVDRRRRLHRQAVLGARTDRAGARAAAPRIAGAGRRRAGRSATSSSTARRSACRAPAARSTSGRPNTACSSS